MNNNTTIKQASMCILLVTIAGTEVIAQQDAVLPAIARDREAPWVNYFPFGSNDDAPSLTWYQQIYGESELTDLVGTYISSVAFRVDGSQQSVRGGIYTLPDLVIRMSTTDKQVDGLSEIMGDNLGDDLVTVYDGEYTLPELRGLDSPNPFDYLIEFQEPFFYSGGNLILDVPVVLVFEPDLAVPLDAAWTNRDSVSRVYERNGRVTRDTFGLVTKFTGVAPAPSTVVAMALGAGVIGARRRRSN